ncbi:Glycogen synthase [Dirofilaria immitis]
MAKVWASINYFIYSSLFFLHVTTLRSSLACSFIYLQKAEKFHGSMQQQRSRSTIRSVHLLSNNLHTNVGGTDCSWSSNKRSYSRLP